MLMILGVYLAVAAICVWVLEECHQVETEARERRAAADRARIRDRRF
jgi:hypothetical protein